ncbi:MAG TPA: hypothetical protein VMU60_10040 [Syntrophobacteria bacterium]|nr:hypothetical protein [Syntrophobacteria bacterium]
MESSHEQSHAFIVRIWLEPREIIGAAPVWRGMIEHVASGERRYVKHLKELEEFVAIYVKKMGVGLGREWWILEWFTQARCRAKLKR